MASNKHKWKKDSMQDIPFESTYKVDECAKCGCLKLHKYVGKFFGASYILDGIESDKLPECKMIKN